MSELTLAQALRARPADVLGALGLVSGAVSAAWGQYFSLEPLQPLAMVFLLNPGALPIGFYYGVAMGLGVAVCTRKPWAMILVLLTTLYAWSAAVHTAVRLQRNSGDDTYLIAASLCAGALGAILTQLGCSIFARELRRLERILLTAVVGAAAGMLFFLSERKFVDERLLYVVWQSAVAFCIGRGMRKDAAPAG
jgi:hypothetical protein